MIQLRHHLYNIRSSFWFLPALVILSMIGLAFALIEADAAIGAEALARWPRLFGAGASGARGLLEAIAGSMITVAGVVFSITLVALTLGSSQYTPRVLRNFMRDRANQTVLGVFVGIFAYCLVVLRTIREGGGGDGFVPSLSVTFALLLGLLGIAVLIFFIHHISLSIQAAQILNSIARETQAMVEQLFPEGIGEEAEEQAPPTDARWQPLASERTGYLQQIDPERLLRLACEHDTIVRLERRVGEFVLEGDPIVSLMLAEPPTESLERHVHLAYAIGSQRTLEQDAGFGIRQLVDIALRALSPSLNDPTTAAMCIEQLAAILARLSERRIESHRRAEDGRLRLLTHGPSYAELVGESFAQIRQHADGDVVVLERLLWALEALATRTSSAARRAVLLDHAQALLAEGERTIAAAREREDFQVHATRVLASLRAG